MKTFKIIRIWKVQAVSRWKALDLFRSLEEASKARDYLDAEFATEDQPKGWWANILKQLTG